MKGYEFIKGVENIVDPIDVGTIHFIQSYTDVVPKSIQTKMIEGGSKLNPYMGFVVEPYSLFLGYEIKDVELAKELLPDRFKLVKSKIFADEEAKYYSIFGCFNVHTSAFWGTRMEFYIIAEDKETGLLSWVIIDYSTNTVSFDNKNGLIGGNTKKCILTTTYDGKLLVDIQNSLDDKKLVVNANVLSGQLKPLDSRMWIEGNLSVCYGRELSKNRPNPFSTVFNTQEVEMALEIPVDNVEIDTNNWYSNLIESKPSKVACFQFAQHYLSDSPGHSSRLMNKEELERAIDKCDFDNIPKYSSRVFKKLFKVGQVVSIILIIVLTILLIIKW